MTQYVQMVNEGFQVFNKTTGASVLGPDRIATLWTGFGGVCETTGDGDPVVLYDQLANRWVDHASSPARASRPTSASPSRRRATRPAPTTATAFTSAPNFFDYPHLGVWPDAYYMAMNVFNSAGTAFLGPQPFAFDRTAMLAGLPATFVTPGLQSTSRRLADLPADLDGSTLPPAGAPNPFVESGRDRRGRSITSTSTLATPANSHLHARRQPGGGRLHRALPGTRVRARSSGRTDAPRRHRRSADVPPRLSQLRRRTKRWSATSPSARAASRAFAGLRSAT